MQEAAESEARDGSPPAGAAWLWGPGACVAALSLVVALQRPYYHDEASTWYFAGGTLAHLRTMLAQDVHPPGWFLLAWAYFKVAGPALFGLRVFSALCMGGAVVVFLDATRRFACLNDLLDPTRPLALYCATAPFLPFAGYFARYYAWVALLSVATAWLAVRHAERPTPRRALACAAAAGFLVLNNYLAGVVVGIPIFGVVFWMDVRRQAWRKVASEAAGFLLTAAPGLVFLASQIFNEAGARMSRSASSMALSFLATAGFVPYSLALGDSLPPWFLESFVAALLMLPVGLWALLTIVRAGTPIRTASLVAAAGLLTVVFLGSLTQEGMQFLFYPTRATFAFFLWAALMLALPASVRPIRRSLLALLIGANLIGLAGLILRQRTSNWAYAIPTREISDYMAAEASQTGATIYLDSASFAQIALDLEQRHPEVQLDEAVDIFDREPGSWCVVLGEVRNDIIYKTLPLRRGYGERRFVTEPPEAAAFKRRIPHYPPTAEKLYVITGIRE